MKVGIVTFWHSKSNYGQLLQCWALQQVLGRLGHDPYLIRYDYMSQRPGKISMFIREGLFKSIKNRIVNHREITRNKKLRKSNLILDASRCFPTFISEHLKVSELVYDNMDMLRAMPPAADAYITGSDQVWSRNPEDESEKAFYLDFGSEDTKKLSYAASFGTGSFPDARISAMKPLLASFDAISVRETSGCDICAAAGYSKARIVLDPTLLLSDDDYNRISDPEISSEEYMLLYGINIDDAQQMDWDNMKLFASGSGHVIRSVTATGHIPGRNEFTGSVAEYPTISRWLALMRNAAMVFTSSFHGVVFSVLFHRNFVFYPLEGRYSGGNERVFDLLDKLNLKGHIWSSGFDYTQVPVPVWEEVDRCLDELRSRSYEFLKDNLV